MQSISIIKTKTDYWIIPESKTVAGLWIATSSFTRLQLDTKSNKLVDNLLQAFNASKQGVPHPKDWKEYDKEFLNKLETKSLKFFYKDAILCEASKISNDISFLPTKNIDGKGRFDHLPSLEIKIYNVTDKEEIYKALNEALYKCE